MLPYLFKVIHYQKIKTKECFFSITKVLLDENKNISWVISIDWGIDEIINLLGEL